MRCVSRLLRPLRTLNRIEGLKRLVDCLVASLPGIANVGGMILSFIFVTSLFGLKMFRGLMRYQCVDEADVPDYDVLSWRGERAFQQKFYPTWVMDEDHPIVTGTADAVEAVLGKAPKISRWVFSTNGVASAGRLGIPSVGFAPALEELAHSTEEWVAVDDMIKSMAVYSMIPEMLAKHKHALLAEGEKA